MSSTAASDLEARVLRLVAGLQRDLGEIIAGARRLRGEREDEVERLRDRVEVLEEALGLRCPAPQCLRLTAQEGRLFGMFCQTGRVLRRDRMFVALNAHRPPEDWPQEKMIQAVMSRVRAKCRPWGIRIETVTGPGWVMDEESRARARELIRNEEFEHDRRQLEAAARGTSEQAEGPTARSRGGCAPG